jgi:rhamnose utilization protein RhaD (predicted bifunctional aldolase and dehydrogenase)
MILPLQPVMQSEYCMTPYLKHRNLNAEHLDAATEKFLVNVLPELLLAETHSTVNELTIAGQKNFTSALQPCQVRF